MIRLHLACLLLASLVIARPDVKGGGFNPQAPVMSNVGGLQTVAKNYDGPNIPTVRPKIPFDAVREAQDIRNSIQGVGHDNLKIARILSTLTRVQRYEVAATYKSLFGRDLLADLVAIYEGKHEDAIEYLFWSPEKMYAREYREAVRGLGTNEEALIEMTVTLSGNELRTTAAAYQEKYEKRLDKDVKGDTSGFFRDLLLALLEGRQPDTMPYPAQIPKNTAEALNNIGAGNWDKHKDTIRDIFCKRSIAELRVTFDEYERLTGQPIEDAIEREFSKDAKKLLLAIIKVVRNRPAYLAECLKNAITPIGSKFEVANRIIIGRSEIDLQNIKEAFFTKYNQSIHDFLKGFMETEYWELMVSVAGYTPEHFKSQ